MSLEYPVGGGKFPETLAERVGVGQGGLVKLESRHQPIASRPRFLRRVALYTLVALGFLTLSLLLGVLGYHSIAGLPWMDALLEASMILTGMGPVAPMTTDGAKLFASVYAIFSGVAFLTTASLLLAPVVHRLLHKLHVVDKSG